jgi:hypothetical protein
MSGNSEPLLLLLNDGRAGHWRQVTALAQQLGGPSIALPVALRQPWRALAPRRFPFGLAAHPELVRALPAQAPQAILSCGRRTALALRWLKAYWGGRPRTVQILHCGIGPEHFDWLVTPRHDGISGPNVILTVGSLNPVDEAWLAAAAPDGSGRPAPRVALLLGGPSRHFTMTRPWLRQRLVELAAAIRRAGGSLEIVASPRAPGWVGVEARAAAVDLVWHFIPWDGGAEAPQAYRAALAAATHLVASADSVNLLSEACATGKPVFVLGADRVRGRVAGCVTALLAAGHARQFAALPDGLSHALYTRPLRETPAVAGHLLRSGLLG